MYLIFEQNYLESAQSYRILEAKPDRAWMGSCTKVFWTMNMVDSRRQCG